MKTIIIILNTIVVTACSSSQQSKKETNIPTDIARRATISENSNSESVDLAQEELIAKPLPDLGDAHTQMQFRVDDSMAIINGGQRPTYPETLAVLAGNPPPGLDICNLSYSALTMKIYQECIKDGMSPIQVSNTLGWAGTKTSSSGSTVIYTWKNQRDGMMTVTFTNNRLVSKSQIGLEQKY